MKKIVSIQIDKISEINRDIAQVFFAGLLVEPFMSHTLTTNSYFAGAILSISFWFLSILSLKE